jgi:hypothetical protein
VLYDQRQAAQDALLAPKAPPAPVTPAAH